MRLENMNKSPATLSSKEQSLQNRISDEKFVLKLLITLLKILKLDYQLIPINSLLNMNIALTS